VLSTLRIQNIALIPSVEINFGPAFNVLTGETGAGKSIIIGSLNFIFGDKLLPSAIRGGADFAKVTAVFHTEHEEIIIMRTLKADGRSEIRINDEPVTLKALRETASALIDIHGQHDTERLLLAKNHIEILDAFGKVNTSAYRTEYDRLQELKRQLASFGDSDEERERLIDLYKYQIDEIENVNISADEEEELNARIIVMRNAQKIAEGLSSAADELSNADAEVGHAIKHFNAVSGYDERLEPLAERLCSVQSETTDILISLREYIDNADYSDADFDKAEERLETIKNIKRKYGHTADEVDAFLVKTKREHERLTNAAETVAELKRQIEAQTQAVLNAGKELSAVRRSTADKMEADLSRHLGGLGMPDAKFAVKFIAGNILRNGTDAVEFYFSANVGEEVKPLSNIISGGEMSRLMLAVKTIVNTEKGKTIVFDEIDTGISGAMGAAVADKMRMLSQSSQIIAVTHLAAIAAAASTHFLIEKSVIDNKTITRVSPLNYNARIGEIARIVGGGDTAVAHAKSLLGAAL
jgi:DNA repair protein RecN (Recombination protein N)